MIKYVLSLLLRIATHTQHILDIWTCPLLMLSLKWGDIHRFHNSLGKYTICFKDTLSIISVLKQLTPPFYVSIYNCMIHFLFQDLNTIQYVSIDLWFCNNKDLISTSMRASNNRKQLTNNWLMHVLVYI